MAKQLLEKLAQAYMKLHNTYGPEHRKTMEALERWAGTSLIQSDFSEAERLFQMFVNRLISLCEPTDARILKAQERLAYALLKLKKFPEAASIYEMIYEIYKTKLSRDQKLFPMVVSGMLSTYLESGQYERLRDQSSEILTALIDESGFSTSLSIHVAELLIASLTKTGNHTLALDLAKQVYDVKVNKYGKSHKVTIDFLRQLIMKYRDVGQYIEAIRLAKQLFAWKQRQFGLNSHEMFEAHLIMHRIYDQAKLLDESIHHLLACIANPTFRLPRNAETLRLLEDMYRSEYDLMCNAKKRLLHIQNAVDRLTPGSKEHTDASIRLEQFKQLSYKYLQMQLKPLHQIRPDAAEKRD